MRLAGALLRFHYLLRRHYVAGLRLDLCGIGLLLSGGLLALRAGLPVAGVSLIGLGVLGAALTVVSQRFGHVGFIPQPGVNCLPPEHPLLPDDLVATSATGVFEVRDQARRLVNHPVSYTTPRSREHVLMAALERRRMLLIATSKSDEWGWWYQFIDPKAIIALVPGMLIHGWSPRPALKVTLLAEKQEGKPKERVTILAFKDEDERQIVWWDLLCDWPGVSASQ